ncbi:lysozyme [Dankookia sp. P2]|uniref:lysozyme n=1 Tax=Dankookia sp. P2 TaxID=3423955 RepID=UPI003D67A892
MRRSLAMLAAILASPFATCAATPPVESVAEALTPGIFLDNAEERASLSRLPPRRATEKGVALVKGFEGFRARLYNDAAGYCSIGYGHLIKKSACDGTEPAEFRDGVNEQAAIALLRQDLGAAEAAATTLVTARLNDGQHDAIVSFVFNVGTGNFRRSTLLRVVNGGPESYNEVRLQLRRWVKAGDRTWPGLQKRREREADMFFDEVGEPRAPAIDLMPIDIRLGEAR